MIQEAQSRSDTKLATKLTAAAKQIAAAPRTKMPEGEGRSLSDSSTPYCSAIADPCSDWIYDGSAPSIGATVCWDNGECVVKSGVTNLAWCQQAASGECVWDGVSHNLKLPTSQGSCVNIASGDVTCDVSEADCNAHNNADIGLHVMRHHGPGEVVNGCCHCMASCDLNHLTQQLTLSCAYHDFNEHVAVMPPPPPLASPSPPQQSPEPAHCDPLWLQNKKCDGGLSIHILDNYLGYDTSSPRVFLGPVHHPPDVDDYEDSYVSARECAAACEQKSIEEGVNSGCCYYRDPTDPINPPGELTFLTCMFHAGGSMVDVPAEYAPISHQFYGSTCGTWPPRPPSPGAPPSRPPTPPPPPSLPPCTLLVNDFVYDMHAEYNQGVPWASFDGMYEACTGAELSTSCRSSWGPPYDDLPRGTTICYDELLSDKQGRPCDYKMIADSSYTITHHEGIRTVDSNYQSIPPVDGYAFCNTNFCECNQFGPFLMNECGFKTFENMSHLALDLPMKPGAVNVSYSHKRFFFDTARSPRVTLCPDLFELPSPPPPPLAMTRAQPPRLMVRMATGMAGTGGWTFRRCGASTR